eukprot:scaffold7958_cov133-Isochrysis_galbana.AAC.3
MSGLCARCGGAMLGSKTPDRQRRQAHLVLAQAGFPSNGRAQWHGLAFWLNFSRSASGEMYGDSWRPISTESSPAVSRSRRPASSLTRASCIFFISRCELRGLDLLSVIMHHAGPIVGRVPVSHTPGRRYHASRCRCDARCAQLPRCPRPDPWPPVIGGDKKQ